MADIAPEPTQAGSNPDNFYAFQGKVHFSANDGIAGNELWKIGRNGCGHVDDRRDEYRPICFIHNPLGATAGNKFYFAVSDPVIGSELYALAQDTIATATSLTISPSSAAVGTPIVMTATVSHTSGSAVPTGSLSFMEGNSTLGTAALDADGIATLTTPTLPIGQHALTAVYSGDSTNSSSICRSYRSP